MSARRVTVPLLALLAGAAFTAAPANAETPPAHRAASTTAQAALATLVVKGRAPKTGYTRAQFGPAWADVDRNGCDTRNDILKRDLTAETFRPGTRGCVVITGQLRSPYTGALVVFAKARASAVQIDHVVALADAWQSGAQVLTLATRRVFANDPLNLLAVDGFSNAQKSASDAASWLPKHKGLPLRVCRPPGRGQGEVPAVGQAG